MPMLPRWVAAIAVALVVSVLIAAEFAYRPPAPRGLDAPLDAFAAARAHRVLTRVLGRQEPHPLGTAANAAVRARLLAELTALGLEPEVQTELVSHRGAVARVHNVLARIEGRRPGAVLLAAHYDSVGAGPGASDDGAAVAAMLEAARALLHGPALAHSVLLLIDDGEELGLFGARAFCQHPWAKEVAVVLNFEARGTGGASLLFETAGPDLWTMRQAARALQRPITGSAFAAIYQTLPNNTDLSVFRQHGLRGLNFAFIGGARRYHTPLDDLAHLDLGSLQHHGDNMLALVRALADDDDLAATTGERALFFDVLGRAVLVLPGRVELPACGGLVLAFVALCLIRRRLGMLRARSLLVGVSAVPAALVLALAAGSGLSLAMQAVGRLPTPFPPNPVAHQAGYGVAGLAAALLVLLVLRRVDPWHLLAGAGGFLALLATAVAYVLPGSSYQCLLPAAALWLAALLPPRSRVLATAVTALAAVTAAVVLAPLFALLPSTIGSNAGGVHASVAAFLAMCLVWIWQPLLGPRLPDATVVAALASAASVGMALLSPAHDDHHPARINLVHVSLAGRPSCFFFDEPLPIAARQRRARPLPWEREGYCVEAPELPLEPPAIECDRRALGHGRFVARGTMRSARGAPWIALCLPPDVQVERARLAGVQVNLRSADARRRTLAGDDGWQTLAFLGAAPGEAIDFEVVYRGTGKLQPHVFDRTLQLPTEAEPLRRARALIRGAPIHAGDGVVLAAPVPSW